MGARSLHVTSFWGSKHLRSRRLQRPEGGVSRYRLKNHMGSRGEHDKKSFVILCQSDLSFGELILQSYIVDCCRDCTDDKLSDVAVVRSSEMLGVSR